MQALTTVQRRDGGNTERPRSKGTGEMRTSMQKDFDAGRPLELDAIAGAITRGGRRHRIQTPATEELVRLVEARLVASAA